MTGSCFAQVHHSAVDSGFPVKFELSEPSKVTLVVETTDGRRVRNLVNAESFPAGSHTVYWDGFDEGLRRYPAGSGIYDVSPQLVSPGDYVVRGVRHPGIDARYEFTVYPTTGKPRWISTEASGGWLADHAPPSDVLYIPAAEAPGGTDQMLIASPVAESGFGMVWTDLEGNKITGVRTVGGQWTGATHLARNLGHGGPKNVYAYTGAGWSNDSNRAAAEIRIMALSTGEVGTPLSAIAGVSNRRFYQVLRMPVTEVKAKAPRAGATMTARASLRGLAAYNGIVLAIIGETDEMVVIRVEGDKGRNTDGGKVIGTLPAQDIKDITFDSNGQLLAIVGDSVRRYKFSVADGKPALSEERTLVAKLDEPVRIRANGDEAFFVSQRGSSHNVLAFAADGKPIGQAGTAWKPVPGKFDPARMSNPAGTTVASDGRLWVAESSYGPKRVSVWNSDGTLAKQFLGPGKYGGGGFLDPKDRNRLYYAERTSLLEFHLDWGKGDGELAAVPYLREPESGPLFFGPRVEPPQMVFYRGDHRYFTNCYSGNPGAGPNFVTLWMQKNDRTLQPLAASGRSDQWPLLDGSEILPTLPDAVKRTRQNNAGENESFVVPSFVTWSDTSGDGVPQASELSFLALNSGENIRTAAYDHDLRVWVLTNQRVLRLDPSFADGAPLPIYDASKAVVEMEDARLLQGGYTDILPGDKDGFILVGGPIWGFDAGGRPMWSYHNRWVGVHASHRSPRSPEYPGQLLGTTRVLGWPQPLPDPSMGGIWAVNSNYAVMYLFTTDGLFLGTVGEFSPPAAQWRMTSLERNAPLTNVNFIGEHFYPTFTRTSDGKYYFVAGKNHASILRLDGIEAISKIPPQTISVTKERLAESQAAATTRQATKSAETPQKVFELPVFPGYRKSAADPKAWANATWVPLEMKRIAFGSFQLGDWRPWSEATAAIFGDRLHVAVRTLEKDLVANTGENSALLFKTGGGIDLQLGTVAAAPADREDPVKGDLRLVVAQANGKTLATLYQPISPEGLKAKEEESFSSPWRTISFDRVVDVSAQIDLVRTDASIELTSDKGTQKKSFRQEFYEFSVPLALLGWSPRPGEEFLADLGVLIGNSGETVQRNYWSNPRAGLVSDVPGEAQVSPPNWGRWKLSPPR